MALKIDYLAELNFNDWELRAMIGEDEEEPVTDAERINYARDLITRIMSGDYDDYFYPSVHTYSLTDRKMRTAVLGCKVEVHGQAGAVPIWDGIFSSRDVYLSSLVSSGYWLGSDLDGLDDAQILAKWRG